jgi:hypothetical protein
MSSEPLIPKREELDDIEFKPAEVPVPSFTEEKELPDICATPYTVAAAKADGAITAAAIAIAKIFFVM